MFFFRFLSTRRWISDLFFSFFVLLRCLDVSKNWLFRWICGRVGVRWFRKCVTPTCQHNRNSWTRPGKRRRAMKNRIAAVKIWILVQKLNIFCHLNKLTICINWIQRTRENGILFACEKRWRVKNYCYAKPPNWYIHALSLSQPNHTGWSKTQKKRRRNIRLRCFENKQSWRFIK